MYVPYLEKRADGADTSVLCFRLAVFLPVDTQVFFFCILLWKLTFIKWMNRHPVNLRGGQKCFLMVFHAILNYCFCAIFRIRFLSIHTYTIHTCTIRTCTIRTCTYSLLCQKLASFTKGFWLWPGPSQPEREHWSSIEFGQTSRSAVSTVPCQQIDFSSNLSTLGLRVTNCDKTRTG